MMAEDSVLNLIDDGGDQSFVDITISGGANNHQNDARKGNKEVESVESITSDSWSNRGVSSKVSITLDTEDITTAIDNDDKTQREANWYTARCFKKMFGNYLLPGLLGITKFRLVDKLHYNHPISKELMANTIYFGSRLRYFLRTELLPEIKSLALEIYFPTGQIEADGLSAISAEIWTATYLLLSIHKRIREADYHNIRSAYTSLVWDSAQNYRATLKFHKSLEAFRSKVLPLWSKIEEVTGLELKNQFSDIDYPRSRPMKMKKRKKHGSFKPASLSSVRIDEDFVLEHTLGLQILPEKKSTGVAEQAFTDLDYGNQVEVIKAVLGKPIDTLHDGPITFKRLEPKLLKEKLTCSNASSIISSRKNAYMHGALLCGLNDKTLTCSQALKILGATLKLLFEEVNMLPSMRADIVDSIRSLADELYEFLGYADWVANKFSEFHSMLRLCYNFASLSFDMDLPSFDDVVKQELASADMYPVEKDNSSSENVNAGKSMGSLEDEKLEYKVVSLTKLMMEASASFISAQKKQSSVDDNFDWQDFYKTQYHTVLQRLPLRVGKHLLQFSRNQNVRSQLFRTNNPKIIAVVSSQAILTSLPGNLPNNKMNM